MNQSVIRYTKEPYIEVVRDSKIESFGFSVFSDAEILKAAEVEVWKSNYYSRVDLTPVPNGLLDPRMGSTTKDKTCATCHGTFTECPGHSGYLKLVLPVYNAGFFNVVVNILKCLCMSCGRVLLDEKVRRDFLKKMRNPKLEATKKAELMKNIVKECSKEAKRTCCRCKYSNGSIRREAGGFAIVQDRKKCKDKFDDECNSALSYRVANAPFKPADILNPVTVLSLFKKMKDEDCELLNLSNRPENLITSIINVPPIALRPSVVMAGKAGSNENDISESLKLIIQANSSLGRDLLDSSYASKAMVSWDILQGESALYIDSDAHVQLNQQSNKKLSGFTQRLNGKQGRFRGNLSAKRVEHTARTVISPDPNLKITEVGIPIFMALKLTYPERVHKHNIEKLRRLVRNGTSKYPGAKFIEFPNGEKMILNARTHRAADALKYGDIVHRHLEDGDIVLFNRQPSLHRMSIMSHRARIMSGKTLRFNECVCNPYNADFDGDEMNLHVPQGEEARTEALELLGVKNNLCTPKNGEILVAATQDFLTTSFLITRKDTFYDRAKFSLLCTYMGDAEDHIDLPTPAISKPIELWTGKQVFSVLTRPNARIRVYVNLSTKEKSYKKPRDKDETMCVNDGYVYIRNGELICGQLGKATLGNGNKSGLFSVLLRDYNADAAATCMNRLAKLSARWIGDHGFSIGIDDVQPGENLSSQKRGKISESYRDCDNLIQSYNKGQLTLEPGCDAAQSLEAKITKELNDIRESAAKVCMNELHWRNSPLIMSQCGSKGSPINISQMIACVGQQSVGGRRAPDGFIERSLPHFPRNSKTPAAKGFVANSFYSGLSATEFFFHTMGGREGLVDTAVKTAETGYMSRRLMKCLEDLSTQYDNTVRNSSGHIVQFLYGDDGMDPALMEGDKGTPLNFDRLMSKVQATCPSMSHVFLSPRKIREDLSKFKETHMRTGYSDEFIGQISRFLENRVKQLENTVNALGLDECCDGERKDLLESVAQNISGVTEKQLQVFLNICQSRYNVKRIEPGTAIGAIGAQSIGEPGTQMTLKTFHFAGVASMNITQGVPRIREIINATKNISTPIITALLEPNNKESHARKVKANVEKTTLGQIAKSIKLVLNSRSAALIVKLDTKRIAASKLCITADMVKDSILENKKYKLTAEDVKVDGETLRIIPNDDKTKIPAHFVLQYLKKLLPSVVVQGIKSVERVVIKKQDPNDKCDKLEDNEPYKLFVEGKGLQKVMGVEGVNGLSTYSNDINEMQHTLGIEAARGTIIDEIEYTMVGHGMSIDTRHMMLLADLMTYKGEVLGITRFGLQKMKESVLMLASFEKTSEHLFNAAVSGRVDAIEGVSECVIMGVPVKVGTGILSVGQRYLSCVMDGTQSYHESSEKSTSNFSDAYIRSRDNVDAFYPGNMLGVTHWDED